MKIIWDDSKYQKLKKERDIDLFEVKTLIENKQYIDILENPSREGQYIIPFFYKNYVYVAAILLKEEEIVIKTCYPSRKAYKKYCGDEE